MDQIGGVKRETAKSHLRTFWSHHEDIWQSGRGHQDDRAKKRSDNSQRLHHKIGPRGIYYMFPIATRVVFRAGSFYDSPEVGF